MKSKIIESIKKNISLIIIVLGFLLTYIYKLSNFPYKASLLNKTGDFIGSVHFTDIWHNGYFFPYKILELLVSFTHLPFSPVTLKIPALAISLFSVILVYEVIKKWHGNYVAFLGTLLFLSWPVSLHLGRSNYSLIVYLLLIPSLYLIRIISGSSIKNNRLYVSLFLQSLIILIPGGIWFVLLSLYFNRNNLITLFKNNLNFIKIFFTLISGLFWVPFVVNNILNARNQFLYFIGINNFSFKLLVSYNTYLTPIKELFISGIKNQSIWLPGSPIFNVFLITFFILGVTFYIKNINATRSRLIISSLVLAYILTLFNPDMIFVLSTVIFFISISGIHTFLLLWTKKFPVNKIAEVFAYSLLTLLVVVSIFYNYRSYFIAWKYSQNTISLFDLRPKN